MLNVLTITNHILFEENNSRNMSKYVIRNQNKTLTFILLDANMEVYEN